MIIEYQGIRCLGGEINRTPGFAPGRGHVLIERKSLGDLVVRYSPVGIARSQQVFWPEGDTLDVGVTFGGTAPSPNAEGGLLNFFGDVIFDSTDAAKGGAANKKVFRRMYVDKTGIQEDSTDAFTKQGKPATVRVNLVDSRTFWPMAGELVGRFNAITPSGTVDLGTLKNQKDLWTFEDLVRKAIKALPTSPVVTFMHPQVQQIKPPVDVVWDHDVPLAVLRSLLESSGLTVALHADDTVGVYLANIQHKRLTFPSSGQNTVAVPETFVENESSRVSYIPRPSVVRVVGRPRRQNTVAAMIPIFTDKNDNIRPLNNIALREAGMTIQGSQATLARLAQWIVARPEKIGLEDLDINEWRLSEEAFRVYMIASAAERMPGSIYSWDFTKTAHPLLPILNPIQPPDKDHERPYEIAPRITGTQYREITFKDKKGLAGAIDAFIESMDEEKDRLREAMKDIKERIDRNTPIIQRIEIQERSYQLSEKTPTDLVGFFLSDRGRALFKRDLIQRYSSSKTLRNLGSELTVDAFTRDRTAQQTVLAALNAELNRLNDEHSKLEIQLANVDIKKQNARNAKDEVVKNHEFRKFFSRHFEVENGTITPGAYEIIPEQGIIRFNDPMFVLKNLAVQDLDSTDVFEPLVSSVAIFYSYEVKRSGQHNRVSFLYGADPDAPEGFSFLGRNAQIDVAPYVVHDPNLAEYIRVNGKTIDQKFDEATEESARGNVKAIFQANRSQKGAAYQLAHFWDIEAKPPVTNLVIGSEGDVPRTVVAMNDPEEPLLGYPSLRQNEEKLRSLSLPSPTGNVNALTGARML